MQHLDLMAEPLSPNYDRLRGRFEARRRDLLRIEQELEKDEAGEPATLSDEVEDELNFIRNRAAELGSGEFDEDLMLHLSDADLREISDIDDALIRIQNETYGICENCANEIPFSRLEAMPYTRYCGACEQKLRKQANYEAR